jgi:capsular exopolysaccharide synthesis family protein
MEIRQYLSLAQRWAWLLALGLILGAAGAFAFSVYQQPVYAAAARVQVISAPKGSGTDVSYIYDQQLAQTYVQTLKTRPILDAVGQRLGYVVTGDQIAAQIVTNTQLIDITVEDTDPQRTAEIANTLVEVFVERNLEIQSRRFSDSEESLKTQIAQVEAQIADLQAQSTAATSAKVQENIDKTSAEMERLQTEIVTLQDEIARLTTPAATNATPSVSPETVLAQINEKNLQLQQLRNTYELYQQIYANLVVLGSSPAGGTDTGLAQMQATLALYQQIRSNLLASYENIRLAQLNSTSNIVSIEPAVAPETPVRPNVPVNTGLGGAVGLMLAAAVIFLIEYLDDTLKTSEQIRDVLGLPVIGYIAEMEHGQENLYVSENPRSPVAEAFRTLRTNLEFASVDQPLKTLLVVSVHPGEGKSVIAANLSFTLAQGGRHVLLIDADLRRPRIHHYLGMTNRIGLSDLFRDSKSIAEVTRPWKDTNLGVITSGGMPPNPADLLASEKMGSILIAAKQAADAVIVDAPPFLVADASILSSRMDGVLLVIRPGKTPIDAALATLEQMKRSGARIIGVVMNRIPRNRPYYYGGYRHYSAYYKGEYSYYDAPHKERSNHSGKNGSGNWFWPFGKQAHKQDKKQAEPAPAEEK